jgi:hypothetical protein
MRAKITAACLCLLSSSALADCTTLAKAMTAVEAEPGVRQKLFTGKAVGETLLVETIKLPDAMYQRPVENALWRRVPLDAAQRKENSEKMLTQLPLSDCSGPRALMDGAVPVQAFDYSQPDPMKSGTVTRSTLWIGADGRIRRLVLQDGMYQTFEYGAFEAPAVEPERRRKAK